MTGNPTLDLFLAMFAGWFARGLIEVLAGQPRVEIELTIKYPDDDGGDWFERNVANPRAPASQN